MARFSLDEDEEKLREACYHGDLDMVKQLIEAGADINSTNKVNKWTALHWAVSRNKFAIIDYLLWKGADRNVENNKGQTPFQLSTSPEIDKYFDSSMPNIENGTRSSEFSSETINNKYGFIPNFIKYPPFTYSGRDTHTPNNTQTRSMLESENRCRDVCIKVRIAEERDFIELDIDLEQCSFVEFKSLLCQELQIESELENVKKIRKLPNVIVRNDRDIKRLKEGCEIELVVERETLS